MKPSFPNFAIQTQWVELQEKGNKTSVTCLRNARLESTKSNPQTKTTSTPRKTSSGKGTPQETGSKKGKPCTQVGKEPNTPTAKGQLGVWFRIHLYVMLTRLSARPGHVQSSPIHDQKVTMVKPTRAYLTVHAKDTMSFGSSIPPNRGSSSQCQLTYELEPP